MCHKFVELLIVSTTALAGRSYKLYIINFDYSFRQPRIREMLYLFDMFIHMGTMDQSTGKSCICTLPK